MTRISELAKLCERRRIKRVKRRAIAAKMASISSERRERQNAVNEMQQYGYAAHPTLKRNARGANAKTVAAQRERDGLYQVHEITVENGRRVSRTVWKQESAQL